MSATSRSRRQEVSAEANAFCTRSSASDRSPPVRRYAVRSSRWPRARTYASNASATSLSRADHLLTDHERVGPGKGCTGLRPGAKVAG